MAQQVHCTVEISGDKLPGIESVTIHQDINDHHSFEVLCRFDDVEKANQSLLDKTRNFIGVVASIRFTTGLNQGKDKSLFKGIVTQVGLDRSGRGKGLVSISGQGLSMGLDGHQGFKGYANKSIRDIAQDACNAVPNLDVVANTIPSKTFEFLLQYNETDFGFIRRLLRRYGSWVYYDGQKLQIGKGRGNEVKLQIGHHLDSFRLSSGLIPFQQSVVVRDYLGGASTDQLDPNPQLPPSHNPLADHIEKESKKLFEYKGAQSGQSFGSDAKVYDKADWKQAVDGVSRSVAATMTVASGNTDQPEITVGSVVSITGKSDGQQFDYGTYFVTRVHHYYSGNDRYTNSFQAIPDTHTGFPYNARVQEPFAGPVPAVVKENNDPKKLGRVRVKFLWHQDALSPWIRCVTSYSGKDRGFYFVPEVNEEVLVDFESGNPDYPIVVGSLYHGKNDFAEHYDADNRYKVLRTIGGNEILFDDKVGEESITITNSTKKVKNTIKITVDGDGKIILSTKGDIELNAEANIKMNAKKDFEIAVQGAMSIKVKKDFKVQSMKTEMKSDQATEVSAGTALKLKATTDASLEGMKTEIKAQAQASLGGAMTEVKASGPLTVQGAIVKIN